MQMLEQGMPWCSQKVVSLAMPSGDKIFIMTSAAKLFLVPINAPPKAQATIKPRSVRAQHAVPRTMAFDAKHSVLVVAGDGQGVDVTFSVWQLEKDDLRLLSVFGSPKANRQPPSPPGLSTWTLAFSPLGEHVALAAPPMHMIMLHLPKATPVDPRTSFAGRSTPATATLTDTLASSLAHTRSVSWWSAAALAMADTGGFIGVAHLPGCSNILGSSRQRFHAGSLLTCVTSGETRGIFVLQPLLDEQMESMARGQAAVAAAGSSRKGAVAPDAMVALPGWQLVLMAQRTPEQMMQVYVRDQAWDAAAELARAHGLDPDAVHRARWSSRPVDAANIHDTLAQMNDRCAIAAYQQHYKT